MFRQPLDCMAWRRVFEQDYFVGGPNECFRSALANALVLLGDRPAAQLAYDNYPKHPFALPKRGVHLALTSRMVLDLTEGKYCGHLHTHRLYSAHPTDLDSELMRFLGDGWEAAASAVRRERQVGRIREYSSAVCLGSLAHANPCVRAVSHYAGNYSSGVAAAYCATLASHAIVEVGRGSDSLLGVFVDNGNVVGITYSSFWRRDRLAGRLVEATQCLLEITRTRRATWHCRRTAA